MLIEPNILQEQISQQIERRGSGGDLGHGRCGTGLVLLFLLQRLLHQECLMLLPEPLLLLVVAAPGAVHLLRRKDRWILPV